MQTTQALTTSIIREFQKQLVELELINIADFIDMQKSLSLELWPIFRESRQRKSGLLNF